MPLLTWIIWLLIVLTVAGFATIFSRSIRLRWFPSLLVAIVATGGTVAGLYLFRFTAQPSPVKITIASPKSGEQVMENRVQVTGTVSQPRARVTLLVRSEKDLYWWVQAVIIPEHVEEGIGKWSLNAYLGKPDVGRGENYQIIALASADSSLFNLLTGRAISSNTTLTTVPLWEQSDPLVVRRIK